MKKEERGEEIRETFISFPIRGAGGKEGRWENGGPVSMKDLNRTGTAPMRRN